MISFVLDAVLILICIALIVSSVKRGFVRTILSIVSSVAAVLLSVVFTPTVSAFFYDKFVLGSITNGIMSTVKSLAGTGDSAGIAEMLESMPEVLSDILGRYNVSDEIVGTMLEDAKAGTASIESVCETIASPIASTISNAVAFVLCFVVSLIVLKIVVAIIDGVFKFPVLKSLNKGAGLLLGIVLAVIVIFVYSSVSVQLVNALGAVSPDLFGEKVIEDTIIVKFFSEHNIFGLINDVIEKELHIKI